MFALRCVCLAELLIRRLSCNCFAYSVLNRAIFMCSFIFFLFLYWTTQLSISDFFPVTMFNEPYFLCSDVECSFY